MLPPASARIRSPASMRSRHFGSPATPCVVQRIRLTQWATRRIYAVLRLNAYLPRAAIASRRGADDLIKAGRVRVNDAPGELNTYVHPGDRVEVDGEQVSPQSLKYVLLDKPAGTVTTARDPQGRPTVVELVEEIPERVV